MHAFDTIRSWFTVPFGWPMAWRFWLGPLLALGVAIIGRLALRGPLAPAGTALALVCGWLSVFGPLQAVSRVWLPRLPAEGLMLATLVAAGAVMALHATLRRHAPILLALLALAGAWWLTGAHSLSVVLADQAVRLGFLALLIWAGMRALLQAEPWPALAASLSLPLALLAADVGGAWTMLGLVVAAVALVQMPGRPAPGALLPAGVGLGGIAGLAVLAQGRLPHGGVGPADIACVAPLLTLWRPGALGRLGPRFGPPLAAALVILAAFVARRLAGG